VRRPGGSNPRHGELGRQHHLLFLFLFFFVSATPWAPERGNHRVKTGSDFTETHHGSTGTGGPALEL